jgi:hypothetical protein
MLPGELRQSELCEFMDLGWQRDLLTSPNLSHCTGRTPAGYTVGWNVSNHDRPGPKQHATT